MMRIGDGMAAVGAHARPVVERVMTEECARRRHLVVSLSGGHAYGFPSPDSDIDLKAIHVEATDALLGLRRPRESFDRMEIIDGVEIDYTSNELGPVLAGILGGNGNYIERILGALPVVSAPELEELAPLVAASLSRRVHHHYRGFAVSQRKAFDEAEAPRAKQILYVLRTALTGAHLLLTGELRVDLTTVCDEHGFGDASELVAAKRAGETAALAPTVREAWRARLDRALALVDEARDRSPLPEEARNTAAIESWLVALRRRS